MEYILDWSEVDGALKQKLSGMQIEDGEGILRDIPVTFYDPDVDITKATLPMFTLYRNGEAYDPSRWDNSEVHDDVTEDAFGNLASCTTREMPEPWNLTYTIRIYTEYQQDMVLINKYLHRLFPRRSFITIKEVEYDVFFQSFNLYGSQYKNFGQVESGKRMFTEQFSIRIEVNLDVHADTKLTHSFVSKPLVITRTEL